MDKISNFIRHNYFAHPTLVLDVEKVRENYLSFKSAYPTASIFYAVKANPDTKILQQLHELGSSFDAASIGEIRQCISIGVRPSQISFGNTVKSGEAIAEAFALGVTLFAADSEQELQKIARFAPHSSIYIRMLVQNNLADWPLSRKFGCVPEKIVPLLQYAKQLGLAPIGISFHVGSQTKHPDMWDATIQTASRIWNRALEVGIELTLLNIGGGFPVKYQEEVTKPAEYGRYISEKINTAFSGIKTLMLEPGRAIVATAGSIAARVMLVSNKGDFQYNWVYLNVGRFSGLAETEGESIRYRFTVLGKEQEPTRQFKVAGPTCDSADILYERNVVSLPRSITYDDIVVINDCGAYTSTYSTICFNGFEPLQVVHV